MGSGGSGEVDHRLDPKEGLDAANGVPAKFRGVGWAEQARPMFNHEAQSLWEPVRPFEFEEDQIAGFGLFLNDLENSQGGAVCHLGMVPAHGLQLP